MQKKRGSKGRAQVGVVASRLALDVKLPHTKHVSFQEYISKVSQKFQNGISLLVKGKNPKSPSPQAYTLTESSWTVVTPSYKSLLRVSCLMCAKATHICMDIAMLVRPLPTSRATLERTSLTMILTTGFTQELPTSSAFLS